MYERVLHVIQVYIQRNPRIHSVAAATPHSLNPPLLPFSENPRTPATHWPLPLSLLSLSRVLPNPLTPSHESNKALKNTLHLFNFPLLLLRSTTLTLTPIFPVLRKLLDGLTAALNTNHHGLTAADPSDLKKTSAILAGGGNGEAEAASPASNPSAERPLIRSQIRSFSSCSVLKKKPLVFVGASLVVWRSEPAARIAPPTVTWDPGLPCSCLLPQSDGSPRFAADSSTVNSPFLAPEHAVADGLDSDLAGLCLL